MRGLFRKPTVDQDHLEIHGRQRRKLAIRRGMLRRRPDCDLRPSYRLLAEWYERRYARGVYRAGKQKESHYVANFISFVFLSLSTYVAIAGGTTPAP